MTKAYERSDFIHSYEARPLRILAEYLEPRTRLEAHGIRRAITFWGSARIAPGADKIGDGRDYYALAYQLGEALARWTTDTHSPGERYHILTGAGLGIMGAAHAGAASVNRGLNVGLNISLPFEQEANKYIPDEQLFEFHYFFTRKFWFLNLSAALVIFPGGFGTLDELFEVLTLVQTGKARARPIILFGEEYWQEVINLQALARQGLISESDLDSVTRVNGVEQALEVLKAGLA